MADDIMDRAVELLELNGWSPLRDNGKHEVWSDGKQRMILPRGKPSPRMKDFLRSEIRRKTIASGRDFVDNRYEHHNKKEKERMNTFNAPKIIESPVTHHSHNTGVYQHMLKQEQPKPAQKLLDKDALEFAKKARADKWTQQRIADALCSMGYVSARGTKITQEKVSQFLLENGIRTQEEHIHTKEESTMELVELPMKEETREKRKYTKRATVSPEESLIKDLEEILTTNMSAPLKVKFIRQLMKESEE